ncbi:MAG: MYXO-CTERM sorting domain-containing protein [Polyangiales bacterium]
MCIASSTSRGGGCNCRAEPASNDPQVLAMLGSLAVLAGVARSRRRGRTR